MIDMKMVLHCLYTSQKEQLMKDANGLCQGNVLLFEK